MCIVIMFVLSFKLIPAHVHRGSCLWLVGPIALGHDQGHRVVESAGRPFSSCLEPERKERRKELEFPVSSIKTCLQQLEDSRPCL